MEEGLEEQTIKSQIPNWLLIVATVLITGLIVGGGVFVWQNAKLLRVKKENQERIQDLNQQIQSLNQEIERLNELRESRDSEIEGEKIYSSNWKTYRNEEYGFEVKYPSGYRVSTTTGTNIGPAITADSYALISFNSDGISEEGAREGYNKIKVDSRNAYRSPIMGNRDGGREFEVIIYNYPIEGEKLRVLFSTKAPDRKEELETFNQILSTFKFIE